MICETCRGDGKRLNPELTVHCTLSGAWIENPHRLPLLVPCDDCGGSGHAHCCDGLRAQPETTP
jgi:DnaJ-class molecular chaperone